MNIIDLSGIICKVKELTTLVKSLIISINNIQNNVKASVSIEAYIDHTPLIKGTLAIASGLYDTSLVITCTALVNKDVSVFRGGLLVPEIDNGSGFFFTKVFDEDFIRFSEPLVGEEHIKIITT